MRALFRAVSASAPRYGRNRFSGDQSCATAESAFKILRWDTSDSLTPNRFSLVQIFLDIIGGRRFQILETSQVSRRSRRLSCIAQTFRARHP